MRNHIHRAITGLLLFLFLAGCHTRQENTRLSTTRPAVVIRSNQRPVPKERIRPDLDQWISGHEVIESASVQFHSSYSETLGHAPIVDGEIQKTLAQALRACRLKVVPASEQADVNIIVDIKGTPLARTYTNGKESIVRYTGALIEGSITIRVHGRLFSFRKFRSLKDPSPSYERSVGQDPKMDAKQLPQQAPYQSLAARNLIAESFREVYWLNPDLNQLISAVREIKDHSEPAGIKSFEPVAGHRLLRGLPFSIGGDAFAIFRVHSKWVADQVWEKLQSTNEPTARYVLIMGLACQKDPRSGPIARQELQDHPENGFAATLALYVLRDIPSLDKYESAEFGPLIFDRNMAIAVRNDQSAVTQLGAGIHSSQPGCYEALALTGRKEAYKILVFGSSLEVFTLFGDDSYEPLSRYTGQVFSKTEDWERWLNTKFPGEEKRSQVINNHN